MIHFAELVVIHFHSEMLCMRLIEFLIILMMAAVDLDIYIVGRRGGLVRWVRREMQVIVE